ncbi:phosphatidylserine decarboxylase [Bacillus sp. AK128]
MIKFFYRSLIELTNQPLVSKWLERLTRSTFSRVFIPSFSRVYRLNQEEMEKPLSEYKTLHDLFTRRLKPTSRIIDQDPYTVISPVDAVLAEMGSISNEQTFIVKDKSYSIAEMLGKDELVTKYINGTFAILYLSPSHYHRIHAPITGQILDSWSLGTSSYPVNKWGIKYGKSPFTKNYRVITEIMSNSKHIAMIKVGAMFVNGIDLTYEGESISKGEELAYFSFGSTIVLLFEKESFTPINSIKAGMEIKVGQVLGDLKTE